MERKIAKKITLKDVVGYVSKKFLGLTNEDGTPNIEAQTESLKEYNFSVAGTVRGTELKSTTMPDGTVISSTALIGQFVAMRETDGSVIESPVLYLPEYFSRALALELEKGDSIAVDIAVAVSLVPDSKAPTGYAYSLVNLIEPKPEDTTTKLVDFLRVKRVPQIEKPKRNPVESDK